jgi:PAS domain S-box-containing protein
MLKKESGISDQNTSVSFKIIIIEDNRNLCRLITKNLQRKGFDTESAFTGKGGLKKITGIGNEIILIDYNLPDMTAKNVISELHKKNIKVPFIVLTGHGDEQIAVEMMKMGASDYIIKQENFLELLAHRLKKVIKELEKESKLEGYRKELERSRERYQNFIRQSSEGIYRLEMASPISTRSSINQQIDKIYENAYIAECNDAFAKMYNIPSKEEIINKNLLHFHKNKDDVINRQLLRNFIKSNYQISAEETREKKDTGEIIWFSNNMFGILDNGNLERIWGTQLNITGRKLAENKLKDREENLRTTLNSIGDAVISTDLNGNIVHMNPVAEELTGWNKESALNKPITEIFKIVNSKTRETVANPVDKVLNKGDIVGLANHTILISKNGKEYQIADSGSPIRNDKGTITGVVLVFRDVTEEYKIRQEIYESKNLLESTMDAIPDAIGVLDNNLNVIRYNKAGHALLNKSPEEVMGKKCYQIIGRNKPCNKCAVVKSLKSKKIEQIERYEDDLDIWVNLRAYPITDKQGNITKIIEHFQDITKYKKLTRDLQDKEKDLRTTLNSIGDAVISTDLDGKIVRMNPVAEDLTDWNKSEAKGKPINTVFKIINSETGETVPNPVEKVLEKKEIVGLANHTILISKEGKEYQIADSGSPIKDEQDNISGVVLVFRDVTEEYEKREQLKQHKNKLQEYKNRLEGTMRIGNLAWWEMDVKSGQVQFNQQKARMLGHSPNAFKHYQDFTQLIHPADYKQTMETMRDHLQGKDSIYKVDYRIKSKNGNYKWFHDVGGVTEVDEKGRPLKITGVVVDITDRKRTEHALKNSEQHYKSLFQDNTIVILLIDPKDGTIIDANQAAVDYYGWNLKQLKQMNISEINTLSDEDIRDVMDKAKTEKRNSFEFKHRLADGRVRDVSVFSNPITSGDRELLYSHVYDITEHKKAEREKQQLQKQLLQAQKLESIGTLAGGVAHDFNNILTVIIGLSQLVLTRIKKSDPNYEKLESILNSAERAAKLTEQLLLFSRKKEMEFESVNLNSVISRLNKMLDRLIGEDITIQNEMSYDLWPVNADVHQIEQVITNLAVNARDAMPGGGDLIISTKNVKIDQEKAKSIPDIRPGRYVRLSIEDTGKGIEKSIQEKIFDPFFTTKGRAKGTGMGLSVVHGIIKKHNGIINVYSESGKGTIFKIYLPAGDKTDDELEPEKESENITQYKGSDETILIVEDEQPVLTYLESILDNYGYNFLSAKNGEEAIEIFKNRKDEIDLLLSDVIMTGIDGVELADKLKAQKQNLKVILSSGYSDKKVAKSAIKDKGYRFIQKPYDILQLLKKINNTIES